MTGSRARRGAGAMGCLIPLLVLAVLGYIGAHASDSALTYYRFRDAMEQEARFAHRKTDEQIKTRLQSLVDSLEMPTSARRINVRRTEARITISADYDQVIEFPFYSKRFDLHPKAERRF